jgi:EAL domain-containing protein (putative c-di-GMP-specific phosphodiesterase class I)/GGDEF domain-containing protein
VLYAGLFAVALGLVALAVYTAVAANAAKQVRGELQANATVFDRLWEMRADQLRDGAVILARDFGFREAVATHDVPTIESALDNLKVRLGIDFAIIVGVDGDLAGVDPKTLGPSAESIRHALDNSENQDAGGVFVLGNTAYQAVSAPVLTPQLVGWVVFASRLDEKEMRSLEGLSAIPLSADVLHRTASGEWIEAGGGGSPALTRFVQTALRNAKDQSPGELSTPQGPAIAVVSRLNALTPETPAVLMLRYPLDKALAPYRSLLGGILGLGLVGLCLVVAGSWALARSVTRPISQLTDAANKLERGEEAEVQVGSRDEIALLASSFNGMAASIRERERKITHSAMHDADTDLPNRRSLQRGLSDLIQDSGDRLVVAAAFGIDRFSQVRAAIGYALASALVGEVGSRMIAFAPDMPVARLVGDQLGLAFIADDLATARKWVSELQAALEQPLEVGGSKVDLTLSAGLAAHRIHGTDPAVLIERAVIAMDQARAARAKIAVFDSEAYGDPAANLSLMSDMLRAMETGELHLHYQPKFDLRGRKVAGVEALARWSHAARGPLSPELFVGMAEETGHIRQLTDWVLERAITEQGVLAGLGHVVPMSINVSGRLIGDRAFAAHALEMASRAKGPLVFEITETAVIDNPAEALETVDRLAAAGIGVSIDDYGSGLSSLAYLKRIRATELKIDKAFVLTMADSQKDALLVRSTIDLAHGLGMKVTAEGVETETALALLAGMGCDLVQGYLTGRPMSLEALGDFLIAQSEAGKPRTARARRRA